MDVEEIRIRIEDALEEIQAIVEEIRLDLDLLDELEEDDEK